MCTDPKRHGGGDGKITKLEGLAGTKLYSDL